MNHVCFFSSGTASWLAAKRVSQKYGTENLYLVFADTSIEDEDNYRFLVEAAEDVGGELIWLKDGRDPWDIYHEKRFINHRQSNCSMELKIKPCRKWTAHKQFDFQDTTLYFGISYDEIERAKAISANWNPFKVEFPLCWDDYGWADSTTIAQELKKANLKRPRLYDFGFAHANCGGFCPKAGQKHYRRLLKYLKQRYLFHEQKEQEFLEYIDRNDIGIVRREGKAITLKQWREIIESEPVQLSLFGEAEGGCGCFLPE